MKLIKHKEGIRFTNVKRAATLCQNKVCKELDLGELLSLKIFKATLINV